jgi:hypothetical protein
MAMPISEDRSGTPIVTLDDFEVTLPAFTFDPRAGVTPLDDIESDLVLITKLYRMELPMALHPAEPSVLELLGRTIQREFHGKRGSTKLLQVPLRNTQGALGRYLLLAGLGPAPSFNGKTVCSVFESLFVQAIELGVETVLVPFVPNRMTKNSLTHKATAFKMKSVLAQVAKRMNGVGKLREIKLFCAPPAVRHIQSGLSIEHGDCGCGGNYRRVSKTKQ